MQEIKQIRTTAERLDDRSVDDVDLDVLAAKLRDVADFAADMMRERDAAMRRAELMEAELDAERDRGRREMIGDILVSFADDLDVDVTLPKENGDG